MSGFNNLRVLSLESRRAREMAQLITNQGGVATVVPCTREIPSGPNRESALFADRLINNKFQVVIFMTGVGVRALAQALEDICPRERFVAALGHTTVVARGPKPIAVLREFGVPVAVSVPEPNTWREILSALDENRERIPLKDASVAVQEHGVPSSELYAGLSQRGAQVFAVPVYKWAPPEDTGPLREVIDRLSLNEFDVVLFTSSVQVHHLFRFANEMGRREAVDRALQVAVIASIGPVTSETLREYGVAVDLEPSHPKMGFLVNETAQRSTDLVLKKRSTSSTM
jgi:uroporphyrinogen-III synthase